MFGFQERVQSLLIGSGHVLKSAKVAYLNPYLKQPNAIRSSQIPTKCDLFSESTVDVDRGTSTLEQMQVGFEFGSDRPLNQ